MDKNGKMIIAEDKILQRWREHFQETLNIVSKNNQAQENEVIPDDNNQEPASFEEVSLAIKKLEMVKQEAKTNF